MLYTAVVGADASIGPYKQVKNSCLLRDSLCEGALSAKLTEGETFS